MNTALIIILMYLAAYLIGAIPFSLLIGLAWGVDIRTKGSGNIGATNVIRNCGPLAGILAYLADIGKGFLSCVLLDLMYRHVLSISNGPLPAALALVMVLAFFIPIFGHSYSLFIRFQGGKGVASAAGIILYLLPVPAATVILLFLLIFGISRIISIASLGAAVLLPPLFALQTVYGAALPGILSCRTPYQEHHFIFLLVLLSLLAVFIIYKHRDNIRRLLKGEENSFSKKK